MTSHINGRLTGTMTPVQSGNGGNSNGKIFDILQFWGLTIRFRTPFLGQYNSSAENKRAFIIYNNAYVFDFHLYCSSS